LEIWGGVFYHRGFRYVELFSVVSYIHVLFLQYKMSEYIMHGLSLSDTQVQKIVRASNKNSSVTIRLSKNNLSGDHELPLTQTQINRINKAKTGLNLTLSCAQIKQLKKEHKKKTGGLIPLLSLIPIIAGALGAAGGVAGVWLVLYLLQTMQKLLLLLLRLN
jgi:hypothetical protein